MKRAILCSTALTLALIAVAITVLGQAGAGTAPASREDARLRFLHASPDAPPLDVLLNGTEVFTNARFGEATDYASLVTGMYTITLRNAGPDAPLVPPIHITDVIVYPRTTVAAAGMLSPRPGESSFHGIIITYTHAIPPPGEVRGRFGHLASDLTFPVTITINGEPLFKGVGYGDVTPYKTVPVGRHTLQVLGPRETIITDTVISEPDRVYSFFTIGLASGPPDLEILQVVDASYDDRIWLPIIKRDG